MSNPPEFSEPEEFTLQRSKDKLERIIEKEVNKLVAGEQSEEQANKNIADGFDSLYSEVRRLFRRLRSLFLTTAHCNL